MAGMTAGTPAVAQSGNNPLPPRKAALLPGASLFFMSVNLYVCELIRVPLSSPHQTGVSPHGRDRPMDLWPYTNAL